MAGKNVAFFPIEEKCHVVSGVYILTELGFGVLRYTANGHKGTFVILSDSEESP